MSLLTNSNLILICKIKITKLSLDSQTNQTRIIIKVNKSWNSILIKLINITNINDLKNSNNKINFVESNQKILQQIKTKSKIRNSKN